MRRRRRCAARFGAIAALGWLFAAVVVLLLAVGCRAASPDGSVINKQQSADAQAAVDRVARTSVGLELALTVLDDATKSQPSNGADHASRNASVQDKINPETTAPLAGSLNRTTDEPLASNELSLADVQAASDADVLTRLLPRLRKTNLTVEMLEHVRPPPVNVTGLFKGQWQMPLLASSRQVLGFAGYSGAMLFHLHTYATSTPDMHVVIGSARLRDGMYLTDAGARYSLFGVHLPHHQLLVALLGSPEFMFTLDDVVELKSMIVSALLMLSLPESETGASPLVASFPRLERHVHRAMLEIVAQARAASIIREPATATSPPSVSDEPDSKKAATESAACTFRAYFALTANETNFSVGPTDSLLPMASPNLEASSRPSKQMSGGLVKAGSAALDSDNNGVLDEEQPRRAGSRRLAQAADNDGDDKFRTEVLVKDDIIKDNDLARLELTHDLDDLNAPFIRLEGHLVARAPFQRRVIDAVAETIHVQFYLDQATNYLTVLVLLTLLEIYFITQQIKRSHTPSAAAKVSLLTIGAQTIMDNYMILAYLTVGALFRQLLPVLGVAALVKFIVFSLFETRYLILLWRSRRELDPNADNSIETIRREVSMFYTRMYLALLIGIFVGYSWLSHIKLLLFVAFSFWVPQIAHNSVRGTNGGLNHKYTIGISCTRLIAPLYFFACPFNVVNAPDVPYAAMLVGWVALQVVVLLLQDMLGSRFFIPALFLPKEYDYYRKVVFTSLTGYDPETARTDCVVCMNEIPYTRRGYMITPCSHIFHTDCLQRWMDVKMQCPTCRQHLVPDTSRAAAWDD
ncbi:hypothetical protein CAOG_07055 [Capsaspora owczarzaki ATCC 30864]|uniref:RING-type E3 ubiquitin transferase n=1 Tax=Capsaspora owczarzaki (strain ATCC 30864) TaxID=595528 RepID=A0A0D2UP64_CAPO3|nr:hypothetical protein CAOG_07055 [Capsaspora owczarzaki ATCC 30864]KJE96786.1 hypothetical protein, variant [Capsaspora owczarzaki ATCC 30864]|eukprot:XP_004343779.2 hypothetical protein CAOG_07055 [Capsaspora owczarzaki ATCC 30864]